MLIHNSIGFDAMNDHKQKDENEETKIAESLIPSSKTPSLIPYNNNKQLQLESPMSLMPMAMRMSSNNIINIENIAIDSPMMSSANNTPMSIIPINYNQLHLNIH